MKLEVTTLRNGRVVKPEGQLGTCGWHPKAWVYARMRRNDTPEQAFLRANPNWSTGDLS
jgi:hypothetical protein